MTGWDVNFRIIWPIKIDTEDVGFEGIEWVYLAQDSVNGRINLNTTCKLRVS
jgi:hypothetical protein